MANRYAVRTGIGVVVGIIAVIVHFSNKSSSSDKFRKQAHRMVANVDGFNASIDYYNWLVDEAHDAVFSDAYYTERRSRFTEDTWVDQEQYFDALFTWMIKQARTDNAGGVAQSLEKYLAQHSSGGDDVEPAGKGEPAKEKTADFIGNPR